MTEDDALVAWARSIWPASFTKRQASKALGTTVRRCRGVKGLMRTGARRIKNGKPHALWRYRAYQLDLPLEDR